MANWKHGLRASIVADADAFRYRLGKIDPELPGLLDQYVRAVGGDLSALDLEVALGLTAKALICRETWSGGSTSAESRSKTSSKTGTAKRSGGVFGRTLCSRR